MAKTPLALFVAFVIFFSPITIGGPSSEAGIGADMSGPALEDPCLDIDGLFSGVRPFFVKNQGQVHNPDIKFYAQGSPLSVGISTSGVLFALEGNPGSEGAPSIFGGIPEDITYFTLTFEGSNMVEPVGVAPLKHRSCFYKYNDPEGWLTGVKSYHEVHYEGIYNGITLRFYFDDGHFKYDFIVAPGANAEGIRLSYEGVSGLRVDPTNGDLIIGTPAGDLRDERPIILQETEDGDLRLPSDFILIEDMSFTFSVPPECSNDLKFVIDPGIEFSTYLGGSKKDQGIIVRVHENGDIYVVGTTTSPDFPWVPWSAGPETIWGDVFLAKFDPTGTSLELSGHYGGSGLDDPNDIVLGQDGSVYIVGTTSSVDFPLNNSLYTFKGSTDAFLMKIHGTSGVATVSTPFGGSDEDLATGIEIGDDGSVYITGNTDSNDDFPFTQDAYCSTCRDKAIFVVKINTDLTQLVYGTSIDGRDGDYCLDSCLDPSGSLYLAGQTYSSKGRDFPITPGAFCSTKNAGLDGYVMKFNITSSSVTYATFLGGYGHDQLYSMALGTNGSVYIAGTTQSADFPTTKDAVDTVLGQSEAFFTMLDGNLSTLQYSTLFGGDGIEFFQMVCVPPAQDIVFLYGRTSSVNLPTTKGTFDPIPRGNNDLFLIGLNMTDRVVQYCTYVGGGRREFMSNNGMDLDKDGRLFLTGSTNSTDFPVTSGAYCETFSGGWNDDAFLVKIDPQPCTLGPDPPTISSAIAGDGYVNLAWEPPPLKGCRVTGYRIYKGTELGNLTEIRQVDWTTLGNNDMDVTNGKVYYYSVSALNDAAEGAMSEPIAVKPLGLPSAPLNLSAETGDGNVTLTWRSPDSTGGELLAYFVLRGFSPSGLVPIATLGIETTYIDEDVVTGNLYYYAVVAVNSVGNGTISEVISVVPLAPPSQPQALTVTPGDGQVDLGWKTPINDGGLLIQGYRVYWGTSRDNMVLLQETARNELTLTKKGLTNGIRYYFIVTAFTSLREGPASTIASAIPFGRPSEPQDLTLESGDGGINLSWHPPANNNGRPVEDYKVYFGQSSGNLEFSKNVGNITSFIHTGLVNGVVYYYQVVAINEAGEGNKSNIANATPMVLPGPPTSFKAESVLEGVSLTWRLPDWTGPGKLRIRIYKAPDGGTLEMLTELKETTGYTDKDVVVGDTYIYQIVAINPVGSPGRLSSVEIVTVDTVPETIDVFDTEAGDGEVLLTWSPPGDGGSAIMGYVVLGGIVQTNLEIIAELGVVLNYTDTEVSNGRTYYYSVYAVNSIGPGQESIVLPATPLGPPGPPWLHDVKYEDGTVILSWEAPTATGRVNETGYWVLRGTSEGALEVIAELGLVYEYVDENVQRDKTYYYAVKANSTRGEGELSQVTTVETKPTGPYDAGWLVQLLIIVLVILVVAMYIWARARREPEAIEAAPSTEEVVAEAMVPEGPQYMVERIFVIFRDGRLIAECARDECKTRDADLMSGMLIAVQGIIQDGLDVGGALESIKYGENMIQIATGRHVNLAAIVYGDPGEELKEDLEAGVRRIEASYSGVIEQWIGDLSTLKDVDRLVAPILERTAHLTREDIAGPFGLGGISMLSAVDFHRGYVRLKVAVVNSTDESIMDATVEVHYDHDMLRLERVKPDTLELRGDQVLLGNIKPEERKTVAFLWDPQICQGTHLDGTLMYYDAKGEIHRVEMKRRHADVVCPIFFTKKHANTAMLRRLISEKLHLSDLRVFRYPPQLTPQEVLALGKQAIADLEVQLVREYIVEGPPLEAEIWFYGETKVKGYQIVMRLGVVEAKTSLEFFAASTAMEPITGLLSEFRREISERLKEKLEGESIEMFEPDEDFKRLIEEQSLLFVKDDDDTD